ncbi:DUF4145 domain-containing protein [Candidatus Uabimicrobium amorphum]|uniref:DUF4145 domain-containing protein n=1 Tax=Uabimicrobium amorphum TaxID=2596890 RepID=A0A5S9ITG1_UABAM|nr:DUF4145 domain-containing protein [Candidatus Uabimicrobium amorphum]BBM87112.1 hypothetical protein UABAM_05515 [Candidatus Uabimicrobium amorphum]
MIYNIFKSVTLDSLPLWLQNDVYKILIHKDSEPDYSLTLCRKLLERLCGEICIYEGLLNKDEILHYKLNAQLKIIERKSTIPKVIMAHLWTIKEYGNCGVHDHREFNKWINSQYTEPCIYALAMFLEWCANAYLVERS